MGKDDGAKRTPQEIYDDFMEEGGPTPIEMHDEWANFMLVMAEAGVPAEITLGLILNTYKNEIGAKEIGIIQARFDLVKNLDELLAVLKTGYSAEDIQKAVRTFKNKFVLMLATLKEWDWSLDEEYHSLRILDMMQEVIQNAYSRNPDEAKDLMEKLVASNIIYYDTSRVEFNEEGLLGLFIMAPDIIPDHQAESLKQEKRQRLARITIH